MRLRILALAATLLGGCAEGGAAPPARFAGGASSLEALAEGVVAALAAGDTAALAAYRVTEHEHNDLLWPELPIASEDPPFPVELAWENLELRNAGDLHRLLPRFAGKDLRLAEASCPGGEEEYPTFTVLQDCRLLLVESGARRFVARPFRSAVVRDGRYKLLRYRWD